MEGWLSYETGYVLVEDAHHGAYPIDRHGG